MCEFHEVVNGTKYCTEGELISMQNDKKTQNINSPNRVEVANVGKNNSSPMIFWGNSTPIDPQIKLVPRIAEMRKKRGIKQHELASLLGLKPNTIQTWEHGRSVIELIEKLRKLCSVLECNFDDLIERQSPSNILIANLRKKQELTQQELAEKTGISRNTIQNWELGKSGLKKIIIIQNLCHILDCGLDDLIEYVPNSQEMEFLEQKFLPQRIPLHPKNRLNTQTLDESVETIIKWILAGESRTVYGANIPVIMEALRNEKFAQKLEKFDLIHPAGMPIIWMMRQLGAINQQRITDLDVFHALCQLSEVISDLRIFFLTDVPDFLEPMKKNITQQFPTLKVAGLKYLDESQNLELIKEINQNQANLVAVYCLNPNEEVVWLNTHKHKIKAVLMGMGTVFQVYSGQYHNHPRQIQELGMDWFFNLVEHPGDKWGTYHQSVPEFIWQILNDRSAIERQILRLFHL